MGYNQKNKWENISLRKLKAQLSGLRDVAVPELLEENLLNSIPCRRTNAVFQERSFWRPVVLGCAVVTVLIAVLSLTIIRDYGSPASSQKPIVDLNDNQVLTDHNTSSECNSLNAMCIPNF